MAQTKETTLDIITAALRMLTVIDELSSPTPEQSSTAITVLNNMMANYNVDGLRMGWFPQTLTNYNIVPAPLQDFDVEGVKYLLSVKLAPHFGIPLTGDLAGLVELADGAMRDLSKRYIKYFNSDLTGLPFPQGGLFGPGRV